MNRLIKCALMFLVACAPFVARARAVTYTPNAPPNAPTLDSPTNATRFNPSANMTFTWAFSDPDAGDNQSAYRFQLDDNSDFSSPIIDTGKVISSNENTTQTLPATVGLYYWRVKTWDNNDNEGPWSDGRSIIVDRILVYSLHACTLTVHLHYEYDGVDITSGSAHPLLFAALLFVLVVLLTCAIWETRRLWW